MNRNYKVIIKNINLHKNCFLVEANSHLDAFSKILNRLPLNPYRQYNAVRITRTKAAIHANIIFRHRIPRRGRRRRRLIAHDSIVVTIILLKGIDNKRKISYNEGQSKGTPMRKSS